ncbi:ADP-ribosylglycohydrolase family protein [Microbacterium sp. NC79]|uniref:ADP-ribosylglycohydrolase family protein n=1 Tax=Microbacterium sp. NC79 TaxID=2851009 RepID=UPI001C2BABBB|nr:ADP-ribosylglycohydrolase family protein [Microbacterium sp. NC79]MBV0895639.1 ADP-ribosylglycohydrolase family protein [Microbacterium sp. NC79]
MTAALRDRAYGAFIGLAVGDALGMPTQCFSRVAISERYGVLSGFEPAPADNEISRGMAAARVTDDTDQAVMIAELLIEGRGHVNPHQLAERFLAWQQRMQARGSEDLLGPSTIRALTAVANGTSPHDSGRWGDTNGAAMRIAPIGIATPAHDVEALVDAVVGASFVTHNTGVAIAGAAAVAAIVSAGISGHDWHDSIDLAFDAIADGETRGHYVPAPSMLARVQWALDIVNENDEHTALDLIADLVGTSVATQESVPAAIAIAQLFRGDAWRAVREAASIGGDCDTIAAMTGAMLGAHHGSGGFPAEARDQLLAVNAGLDLDSLVDGLLALRAAA